MHSGWSLWSWTRTGCGMLLALAVGSSSSCARDGADAGADSGGAVACPEPCPPRPPTFLFGADLSSVPEQREAGAVFFDVDGEERTPVEILAAHGFNAIRLRTFVNPVAPYGYAVGDGSSLCAKTEGYCDLEHTIAFGREVKEAGLSLLVDLHYSDTWADPGKQIIPEAWRAARTIEELASFVENYTADSLAQMVNSGARPDVIQIGNEITSGMLMHLPTSNTDCWGNGVALNEVSGSASDWTKLATLLKAGIAAVRAIDPSIRVMLHIENTEIAPATVAWVGKAIDAGVEFNILGLSCYPAFQGDPAVWKETVETLAAAYPDLQLAVAEYGPNAAEVMAMLRDLPKGRGFGSFLWEPTLSGEWGPSSFLIDGQSFHADPELFGTYSDLAKSMAQP